MSNQITLQGSLLLGADGCSPCGSGGSTNRHALALRCSAYYQTVVDTVPSAPIQLATPGAVGAAFVDLDLLGDLTSIEFLYVRSSAPIQVRIGAAEARMVGIGAAFATVLNSETLNLEFDGTAVAVVFVVPSDTTGAAIVNRINAACALAGLPTPRASLDTAGQLVLTGMTTGEDGAVEVVSGTASAKLGLTNGTTAHGAGADVPANGTLMIEFPSYGDPATPTRIQFSGTATLDVVAGGRSSAV